MRRTSLALAAALTLGVLGAPAIARADGEEAPSAEALQKAASHFRAGREFYAQGAYGKAIAELERARAFDPTAKDLIFNLATVCEKAGRTEDAINYFKEYLQRNLDGGERAKVEATVKRLEGVLADQAKVAPKPPPEDKAAPPQLIYVPTPVESPPRGRLDALTISMGVLAIAGLGVGGTFGVLALTNRPAQGLTTGSTANNGLAVTYQELADRTARAHTFAIISDIGFLVGVAATAATLGFFFGRTKYPATDSETPAPAPHKKPKPEITSVSAAPIAGGGAFLIGGTF